MEEKEIFLPKHLTQIERLSDIHISRAMGRIVFTATHLHEDGDRYLSTIYRIPFDLELRDRDKIRVMTQRGRLDYQPRFAPKGELTFISTRNDNIPQVFLIHSDGGEAQQITNVLTGVEKFEWLPDGENLIIQSSVYPDLDTQAENIQRDRDKEKSKVEGIILEGYPIRNWNHYIGPKYPHLFLYNIKRHELKDLTKSATIDYIDRHWKVSNDGKKLAVVFNEVGKDMRVYTNLGIIDIETAERERFTDDRHIYHNPRLSFDGTKLLCEYRPFEEGKVGKRDLILMDVESKEVENITKDLDFWPFDGDWVAYSEDLIFHAEIKGTTQIWVYHAKNKKAVPLVTEGHNYGSRISPDGRNVLYIHEESDKPGDMYMKSIKHINKAPNRLTDFNKELMDKLTLTKAEFIETKGANDTPIQSMLIKPVNFDPSKKYPLLVFLHGGPYVSFRDRFNYRFNHQPYVNRGYLVLKINARGSIGFGQKFIEENMGKWGDLGFKDIMLTIDQVCKEPFVDRENIAALGTSFGGYMVNWIASQTESNDRFRCFVSYAGIYNLISFYGTTDLSQKYEHEFSGTPVENFEAYRKWSPSTYAKAFKKPMLIVHGGKDYRVSYSESLQLYTALESIGVKCKLLFFKDESHWIMRPNNYIMFYNTVLDWLDEHLKK